MRPLSDHPAINERGSRGRGNGGRQHAQRGALSCSIGAQQTKPAFMRPSALRV